MVDTECAPRQQYFYMAPAMQQPNSVTTSVAVRNTLCKATVTHTDLHTTGSGEQRYIVAIVKHLGLILK